MPGFDESELEEVTEEEAAEAGVKPTSAPRPAPGPVQTPQVVTGTMEQIVANLMGGGQTQQAQPTADQTVEEAVQQTDEYMRSVDQRLELAMVYREFLNGNMFEKGTETEASRTGEREVRAFVRERLGDLMNVSGGSRPKVQQLTEAEVVVVRSLAELTPEQILGLKLMAEKARAMISGTPPAPAAPPRPVAQPATPPPPRVPTLVRRQAPAQSPQTQTPVPPQRAQEAAPVPAPATPPRRGGPGRGHRGPQVFRERTTSHPDGNGQSVEIVTRDQRKQRPAGMLPMPASNLEMEAATAMASAKTAASVQQSTSLVQRAIVAINNTPTDTE